MIHWQQIRTTLLDMDGTLLDLKFDNFFWRRYLVENYAQLKSISVMDAQNLILQKYLACENSLDWYCTTYWSAELGLDVVALKQKVAAQISLRQHTIEFLQFVQSHSSRALLVTNAHPDTVKIKLAQTGIDAYVDAVISSHDLGLPKEDQGFWGALQKIEPFDEEFTLLIDDNTSVLNSAKAHGIKHLYSIRQPDSSRPPNHQQSYPAIEDFAHVICPSV